MKITTTVLAFLLISVNLLSQKAKFTWGEYEKSNFERLGAIVPIAKNEFFIKNIEVSNMGTKEVHVIKHYKDFKEIKTLNLDENTGLPETFSVWQFKEIGNRVFLIIGVQEMVTIKLYLLELDKQCNAVGNAKLLLTRDNKIDYSNKLVVSSPNQEHFLILFKSSQPGYEKVNSHVFDLNGKEISSSSFEFEVAENEQILINHVDLNNSQKSVIFFRHTFKSEGKTPFFNMGFKKVGQTNQKTVMENFIAICDDGKCNVKPIDVDGTVIHSICNSKFDNQEIHLAGFCRDNTSKDGAFIFFNQVRSTNDLSVKQVKFAPLQVNYHLKQTGRFVNHQVEWLNKNFVFDNMINFIHKKTIVGEDFSTMYFEVNYNFVVQMNTSEGTRDRTIKAHTDVVAVQINNAGNINWISVIPKLDLSYTDIDYLSFAVVSDKDHALILFNDTKDNYINGKHKGTDLVRSTGDVLGGVYLSLKDGTFTRSILGTRKEFGGYAIINEASYFSNDPGKLVIPMFRYLKDRTRHGLVEIN